MKQFKLLKKRMIYSNGTKFSKAAKMLFGWDPKKDKIETVDFTSFSELVEVIKFFPKK